MPFEPGKSGNPGGRVKAPKGVLERLRELTPDAVEGIAVILGNPAHKHHFEACKEVLNRVLGMPKQPIGLEDDGAGNVVAATSLARVLANLERAFGTGSGGAGVDHAVVGDAPSKPDAPAG